MMPDHHHSQMDTIIQDALEEVEMKGTAANDRSLMLAGLWWLSRQRSHGDGGRRRKRDLVIPVVERGGPWAALCAALLYITERGLL